jgi:hypothetical protein
MAARSAKSYPAFMAKCDTYFEWAYATDFAFVFREDSWRPIDEEPRGSTDVVGLLVEWESLDAAAQAATEARRFGILVPAIYAGSDIGKIRTIWALTVKIDTLTDFLNSVEPLLKQLELAAPIAPAKLVFENLKGSRSQGDLLAAVLDDGCAFANERFRSATGTRVLWLWNQDPGALGAPLSGGNGPSAALNFSYGGQWSKADLDNIFPNLVTTQEEAYRKAGLVGLRRWVSHGTHVMDLLTRKPIDTSEIVFVQFPQAGVDDPSGLWLKRFALDGLLYVVECAGPNTRTIAANMSWGPQTGPHDGSSILERAIEKIIADQLAINRKLYFSLPAGNSFESQAHASVDYVQGGSFEWLVPPDGNTPAFIELWWPSPVTPSQANLWISPPGGAAVKVTPGMANPPNGSWWARIRKVGAYTKALLVVHPTAGPVKTFAAGLHGRWKIRIDPTASGPPGTVQAYVARADHNMGARRRARASRLSDPGLEAARFVAPAYRYNEAANSVIERQGTLNGVATGPSTLVAGGYRYRPMESAPYSSSGRSRGARIGPNDACISDRSQATPGIRASAVRSGTTAVLVGTSTASPQLCRARATNTAVALPTPPIPGPLRVGAAYLKPDPDLTR